MRIDWDTNLMISFPEGRAGPSECDVGADASCSGHSTNHRANLLGWMSLGVPC